MKQRSTYDERRVRRLVRRSAGGDRAAFGELYDLTSNATWRVARAAGADERQAGEVLVGAYVELWRRCGDPDVRRRPGRWLLVRVHDAARSAGGGPSPLPAG